VAGAGGTNLLQPLTQEQWQFLWNKATTTEVRDWLFSLISNEAGFDVQSDVVVKMT
jgi:hypothetical protein